MKIDLKSGEHVRISHDNSTGCFMVYLADGYLHVRALEPSEGHSAVVLGAGAPPVTMESEK